MARLTVDDLDDDTRKRIGVKKERKTFPMEAVRRYALEALYPLRGLDKGQRERVLKHALKVNRV